MQQPPGFVPKGESHKVCLLRKSIYGLSQSPQALFEKFSNLLLDYGLTRTMSEYSVFVKTSSVGCVVLVVYADDIIISGNGRLSNGWLLRFILRTFVSYSIS